MVRLWSAADEQVLAVLNGTDCALYVVRGEHGYGTSVGDPTRAGTFELVDHDVGALSIPWHHCVEGWSATADWSGVRVSEIAKLVGAEDVDYVEFKSFDRDGRGRDYWSSWDRDSAMHPQTLLAYGMNGRPLSPEHGAPVRLYGAVKLGYKQVKYLTEVNFLSEETGGYWEALGYEWFAGT